MGPPPITRRFRGSSVSEKTVSLVRIAGLFEALDRRRGRPVAGRDYGLRKLERFSCDAHAVRAYYSVGIEGRVLALAHTVAFTGIIVLEKMNVFNNRALRAPLSEVGLFSNPWVLSAWTATLVLQVPAVYVPFFRRALHTVPLGWEDWEIIIVAQQTESALAESSATSEHARIQARFRHVSVPGADRAVVVGVFADGID